MQFDILTLFPEMVSGVLSESILGRAQKAGHITVRCHQIRDYSENKHRNVDDTPYGGGVGMVMAAPPIYACFRAATADIPEENRRRVIYLSPRGRHFTQDVARELCEYDQILLLCGHYEGIDERVIEEIVDEELSIGDYVLTGGELPACIVVDAVARLQGGVLSDPATAKIHSTVDMGSFCACVYVAVIVSKILFALIVSIVRDGVAIVKNTEAEVCST
jgi:tRNA (guanine37-N1)-methyltransferase